MLARYVLFYTHRAAGLNTNREEQKQKEGGREGERERERKGEREWEGEREDERERERWGEREGARVRMCVCACLCVSVSSANVRVCVCVGVWVHERIHSCLISDEGVQSFTSMFFVCVHVFCCCLCVCVYVQMREHILTSSVIKVCNASHLWLLEIAGSLRRRWRLSHFCLSALHVWYLQICKCIYIDKCHWEARGLPILARRVYVFSMDWFVSEDTYTDIIKIHTQISWRSSLCIQYLLSAHL